MEPQNTSTGENSTPVVTPQPNPVETAPVSAAPSTTGPNTSGQGSGAPLPDGIKGWSWGAFGFNWIWGIFNGTFIALLALIPFINIIIVFVLGFKGREWAWQNKRWESVEHFNKVQRIWSIVWWVVTGLFLLLAILGILAAVVLASLSTAREKANEAKMMSMASSTQVSTAPQTWTDPENRYQLVIPSGWSIEPAEGYDLVLISADDAGIFYIMSKPEEAGETLEDYKKEAIANKYTVKETTLGNQRALSSSASEGSEKSTTMLTLYKGTFYALAFSVDESIASPAGKDAADFEAMLTSFKFLK